MKTFLKAGVLNDLGDREESLTGTRHPGPATIKIRTINPRAA